ncbi:MAG TPA: serine hydrolase [Bacillota bacterium]|nr:serine hydrolase [Clostridiales bacterium]HPT84396.1 serine hydrolase [Bacillota bacterium]
MDLKIQSSTVLMLRRLLDRATPVKPCVEYSPSKPDPMRDESRYFPRTTPEKAGIPPQLIEKILRALRDDPCSELHTLMILRGGKVAFELECGAYSLDVPAQVHSLAKSVTAMGVGLAISEGLLSLDSRAVDFFPGRLNPLSYLTHKDITVRSLLTMSSGVAFSETGAVTSSDWARDFFESEIKSEPGLKFAYNSMNSYILSEIVRAASGMPLGEYLRTRLFEPLGITAWAWETSPTGAEKGGWGLYLRPEDMAKLGVLWLSGGRWEGSQVLPREWVREASIQRMRAPKKYGSFNYGYHVWVARDGSCTLFNGMFGQNVFMFPKNDIVVVTTGASGETFQQGVLYRAVIDAFSPLLPPECVKCQSADYERLERLSAWFKRIPRGHCEDAIEGGRDAFADALDGAEYMVVSNARAVGILPLITQAMQNNYSSQITRAAFKINRDEEGVKSVAISLGYDGGDDGVDFTFEAGCRGYEYGSLEFGGEKYLTGALAVFTADEEDNPVLVVYLYFPELSSRRIIRFYPSHRFIGADGKLRFGSLRAEFDEVPGAEFIARVVTSVLGDIPLASVFDLIRLKDDADIIEHTVRRAFLPQVKFTIKELDEPASGEDTES